MGQNFGRPRRSTPTSFVFFGKGEREREFFLLSWKDASRSTERRFHQEGRGRQPPICEPVRGDVPQRPRARGRRREVRPGRERARDPARSRHALVLRQLHPLLWSRVARLHRLRRPRELPGRYPKRSSDGLLPKLGDLVDPAPFLVRAVHVRQAPALHEHQPRRGHGPSVPQVHQVALLGDRGGLHHLDGPPRGHRLRHRDQPVQPERPALRRRPALVLVHHGLPGFFVQGVLLHRAHGLRARGHHVDRPLRRVGHGANGLRGLRQGSLPPSSAHGRERHSEHHRDHRCRRDAPEPYLHSGALESRRAPNVEKYKRQAVWLGLWDPFIPILSTTVVNWAIAALAAIFVYGNTNVPEGESLGIASFPKYLQIKGGTIMWGIALIAAAQSSCITTTYSGQFVMDGFLKINLPKWARAIITRCVAVVPCVIVAAVLDDKAMELMIDVVNSSLAFLLPFALIPLTRLTTSKQYMGDKFVAKRYETWLIWAANLLCFGINFYTLVAPDGAYFGQYTSMATVVGVQMNIIQDLVCAFYIVYCVYMAFAPVKGSPLPIRQEMGDPQIDTELAASIEKKSVEMTNPPQ